MVILATDGYQSSHLTKFLKESSKYDEISSYCNIKATLALQLFQK